MTWHLPIYDAILFSAVAGLVVLASASAALLFISQPVRRIRLIEITLAGLLVLPLVLLIPGYPRIALLPPIPRAPEIEQTAPAPRAAGVSPVPTPSPAPRTTSFPPVPSSTPSVSPQPRATTVAPVPSAPSKPTWQLPRDVRLYIVVAYLAGTGTMIAWSLLGLVAIARLLRSARQANDAVRAVFRDVAGPASARVALVVSPRAGQPCALVWRRPTIVLPQCLVDGGDARQLRFALAHEWSHVVRGDVWSWSLSSVVRWFYFYQPLLWHLRRQLRLCQDYLADAGSAGSASEDYAEFLTSYSSQLKHPNFAPGLGIAGRASELHRRVVMLLDPHRPLESTAPRRWNLVVLPLAVLLLAAIACVRSEPGGEASDAAQAAAKPHRQSPPFNGRIRPGDILSIDFAGGKDAHPIPYRSTVEPDGNLALGALYGRVNVGGQTLHEAESIIRQRFLEYFKDPQVQLTYVGHDPDVVAADERISAAQTPPPRPAADAPLLPPEDDRPPLLPQDEPRSQEPLQPLDTVEILIPLKPLVRYEVVDGKRVEVMGTMPDFNRIYVIEPGGDISLPHDCGRVNVKGLDVRQAGKAIRNRLAEKMLTRTALPAVYVAKRGRAEFPKDKEPPADYRIRKGDSLLIRDNFNEDAYNYEVDTDGNLPKYLEHVVHVEGLTLAEAQQAVYKGWIAPAEKNPRPFHGGWFLTIGGWREQADPDLIDSLEATDATRTQRIERELQDLKNMIRQLQSNP